jgi:cytochrome c-type biogenesis protein CcmH
MTIVIIALTGLVLFALLWPLRGQDRAGLWPRRIAALVILSAIPGLSLWLYYGLLGAPDRPDMPLAARQAAPADSIDITMAVDRIERHLASAPDDARGWQILVPVYMKLGRFTQAADALGQVSRLLGPEAARETERGRALVAAASGRVDEQAREAFAAALRLDPGAPEPLYYQGLAAWQDGKRNEARQIWSALLEKAPPDAPWAPFVRARLAAIDTVPAETGAGAKTRMEDTKTTAADPSAMIQSMVDGLAQRLAEKGGTPEEWAKLVRSWGVLHKADKAAAARTAARQALAGDPPALTRFEALVSALSVGAPPP